jgi:hypothetical protein
MRIINGISLFVCGGIFIELSNHVNYSLVSDLYLVIGIISMASGCTQIFLKHNKTKK